MKNEHGSATAVSAPTAESGKLTSDTTVWPNPVYAWFVVGMLSFANCLSFLDRMILALLVGPIRQDLHITDTQFSLLHGLAFAIFYTTFGIPLARIADRKSRRFLISAGIFFWSLMTASCGLAKSFWHLFFARIGVGVGEATLFPATNSLLGDYFPSAKLAKALAVYSVGTHIGAGLSLIIGGAIIGLVSSSDGIVVPFIGLLRPWQIVFICIGLPGVLFALIFSVTVKEPARRASSVSTAGSNINDNGTFRSVIHFVLKYRKFYFNHTVGMSFMMVLGLGTAAWNPAFFMRTYGVPISDVGLWYGLSVAVAGTGGAVLGGWLVSDLFRRGYKDANLRASVFGITCSVPFGVLYPLMPDVSSALVVFALFYFFFCLPWGGMFAALHHLTPNSMKAQITALFLLFINLAGLGLGPTLIAMITDFVFESDADLRYSILLVIVVMSPLTLFFVCRAMKALRQEL